ncbi:MAG: hypothetical protein AAGA23_00970 [Pseudomonadota bacterium]
MNLSTSTSRLRYLLHYSLFAALVAPFVVVSQDFPLDSGTDDPRRGDRCR